MAETGISIPVIAARLNMSYPQVINALEAQGKAIDYPTNAHVDTPEEVTLWKYFAEIEEESTGMIAFRFGLPFPTIQKTLAPYHGDSLPDGTDEEIQIFLTVNP